MYEKIKRSDEDFIAIGSVEDESLIKRMNKKDSSKGEESEKENDELRLCLTIAPDEDKEVDYEILDKKYPIIDWKTENLGTKPQIDESKRSEEINMNVVTRSNGQKRSFSTLMRVLSVFDREDLDAVYKLVMNIYQDKIPEGFDKVLWGDLIVMFNPDEQDEFWNSQHEWNVVPSELHSSSGYTLLKLESEEESTMALELIRFIKKICDKKNKVLFTDTECLVLSPELKLPDENQVLLRIPRQHNMYSFNLGNIVPSGGLACLRTLFLLENMDFIEFNGSKGIKREYSNARTPQQNGVAERKNMTLIEAARTMLADSFLPNTMLADSYSGQLFSFSRDPKTPLQESTGT
ncbi:ribonuclease H-like domain-containing protein [Tanacetum coccineum]|uniref:Ribonuclease H-like domain-containing protein n=1 Tax=Tanacetum coccineum TaxID=301880 RepID=A0ABQ5GNP4_9ASTR